MNFSFSGHLRTACCSVQGPVGCLPAELRRGHPVLSELGILTSRKRASPHSTTALTFFSHAQSSISFALCLNLPPHALDEHGVLRQRQIIIQSLRFSLPPSRQDYISPLLSKRLQRLDTGSQTLPVASDCIAASMNSCSKVLAWTAPHSINAWMHIRE